MKYIVNKSIIVEVFEDEEAIAYDTVSQTTYLLNATAMQALRCFQLNGQNFEGAKCMYMRSFMQLNVEKESLEEDFEYIFNMLLNHRIVISENANI